MVNVVGKLMNYLTESVDAVEPHAQHSRWPATNIRAGEESSGRFYPPSSIGENRDVRVNNDYYFRQNVGNQISHGNIVERHRYSGLPLDLPGDNLKSDIECSIQNIVTKNEKYEGCKTSRSKAPTSKHTELSGAKDFGEIDSKVYADYMAQCLKMDCDGAETIHKEFKKNMHVTEKCVWISTLDYAVRLASIFEKAEKPLDASKSRLVFWALVTISQKYHQDHTWSEKHLCTKMRIDFRQFRSLEARLFGRLDYNATPTPGFHEKANAIFNGT